VTSHAGGCGFLGLGCVVSSIGHAAVSAGEWAWQNRVNIANFGALAVCLSGVGTGLCAVAQGLAFIARSSARVHRFGFRGSLGANVADGVLTVSGIAVAGALGAGEGGDALMGSSRVEVPSPAESFPIGGKYGLGVIGSTSDIVGTFGGYLPSHNQIFFNSSP
jgi:hypothetical protein